MVDNGGPNAPYEVTYNSLEIKAPDARGYLLTFTDFDLNEEDYLSIVGVTDDGSWGFFGRFTNQSLADTTLRINTPRISIQFVGASGNPEEAQGFEMEWSCLTVAAPVAAFSGRSDLCNNRMVLTDETTGLPDSWQWFLNGELAGLGPNPVIELPGPGTYDVTLLACNELGCNEVTTENYLVYTEEDLEVLGCLTSTPEPDAFNDAVRIFPNPSNGNIQLDGLGALASDWEITVVDALGRRIQQLSLTEQEGVERVSLALQPISSGVYYLLGRTPANDKAFRKRLVIK